MTTTEPCESLTQWIHQKTVCHSYQMSEHLHTVSQSDTDTKSHFMMYSKGGWQQWELITVLPVMGVSSSSGCADISMATLPSRLDLSRLREPGRFSDSMARTVNSVASKAVSTGMDSYWSVCPPSPCSAQSSSCSHWGGSGMSAPLKEERNYHWTYISTTFMCMLLHGNSCRKNLYH